MIDRDKVVKGLKCCSQNLEACDECPYRSESYYDAEIGCVELITKDALELLEAQEPRILTLEELEEGEAYWLEERCSIGYNVLLCGIEKDNRYPFAGFVRTYDSTAFDLNDYGKTWRCWSSHPTDKQKERTPWEKD